MFRFSIRDLLWLTLVVAVGLGWWTHEQRLRAEADKALGQAKGWRTSAGALECALNEDGYEVRWDLESSEVVVSWHAAEGASRERLYSSKIRYLPTNLLEPSVGKD